MKMFKKSTMSLALTAAMIGGVATTQQVSANADLNGAVAGGTAYAPGQPFVSNNRLGQALVFPYYTTRGGKKSIINIFNTSNKTIAAKVRFHESHNSRDVLDFVVVLSPFDKWAGTVEEGNTGPIFKSRDNTCTVPSIPSQGIALESGAYSGGYADADQATDAIDRLREGYVEVIAMGSAASDALGYTGDTAPRGGSAAPFPGGNSGNVAYNANHVAGIPRDCGKVTAAFVAGSGSAAAVGGQGPVSSGLNDNFIPVLNPTSLDFTTNGVGGNGSPMAASEFNGMVVGENPLRGALTIISTTSGVGFGTAATAIGDFADPTSADMTGVAAATAINGGTNTANLITAQNLPYFLEPTMASRDGIWTTSGLPNVEASIEANTVINEWSNNLLNGAATDWVIQFPTKAFHVDIPYGSVANATGCSNQNIQAAVNLWRGNAGPNSVPNAGACTAMLPPFERRFGANGAAVTIASTIYDKEERSTSGGVSFSPKPFSVPTIPWESNVITFSGDGGTSVLSSTSPEVSFDPVSTLPGSGTNGMALISFPASGSFAGGVFTPAPLPVVGFVAKERNQGAATLSFGQIMDHSYR